MAHNDQKMGKVRDEWTLCDPVIDVYDSKNDKKWVITGTCCQCGYLCRERFGYMTDANFGIYSSDKSDMSADNSDGQIIKHARGLAGIVGDSDTFEVIFPQNATPEDKFNLISSSLLMDYLFYEAVGVGGGYNTYY